MKKLIIAVAAVAAGVLSARAAEEIEKVDDAPIFWGFGDYGIYSGYQLYGNLVNSEPTLQGYLEGNVNIPGSFGCFDDFGYIGIGVWSNTDLTDKRRDSYGKAFNEWDYNVHYVKTFYFDDAKQWGLEYRASVVWYYYPHRRHQRIPTAWGGKRSTSTTMDFNHSFSLVNPYVVPFLDVVHEYHENNADLLQFGLKRKCVIDKKFSLTPSVTFVYRDHRYNWCFPTAGFSEFHNGSVATMKWMLEVNYQISANFGVFAKVAYCSIIDRDLRDAAENGSGADYSQYKDFAWGGVGISVKF